MYRFSTFVLILFRGSKALLFFLCTLSAYAQISIGTPTPHPSAQLEINSNNKGVLLPRVPVYSKPGSPGVPIPPTDGLILYQTLNAPGLYLYSENRWGKLVQEFDVSPLSYAFATSTFSSGYVLNAIPIWGAFVDFSLPETTPDFYIDSSYPTGVTVNTAGTYRIEYDVTPISVSGSPYQVILTFGQSSGNAAVPNSAFKSSDSNINVHGHIIKYVPAYTRVGLIFLPINPAATTTSSLRFGSADYDHGVSIKLTRLR